jgi:nucleotidyltransferase substrate binding protein (TIGR01987 family)
MELLTSPLEKALAQLELHIGLAESSLAESDVALRSTFRTAAIKSFEFTYALAIAMIDRLLMMDSRNPEEVEDMDFQERMRAAWEKGYVRAAEDWVGYRAYRNITSHTYREEKAAEVYAVLPGFVEGVNHLLAKAESAAHAS